MTAPTSYYRLNPEQILERKQNAIENRLKGCKGCSRLQFDASGDKIYAVCDRGRKVGRKGKCTLFKEAE